MAMTRHLALEGVDNFRDFGDYPAVGGRRLKRGRLYRSASHGRATDGDLAAIAALDLAVIVDLRRTSERLRDPSLRHRTFAGAVIENDIGDDEPDPWREHIRASDLSAASFRAYLLDYYRVAPFNARHIDLFSRYFRALALADGPVLIHCAAGKDRTGVLIAVLLGLLGVPDETIVADYALSAQAMTALRRKLIERHPEGEEVITRANELFSAAPSNITNLLEVLRERYGSITAYGEAAGIGPDVVASLRDVLLEAPG